MSQRSKFLESALNYDPIADAEDRFGAIEKSDKAMAQALASVYEHGQMKRRLLGDANDSYYNIPLSDFIAIAEDIGFRQVLKVDFKSRDGNDESFYIFWHDDGLLLKFDSYCGHLNGGDFYYNWLMKDTKRCWEFTSNGHMHWTDYMDSDNENCTDIWVGHHNCVEAMRYNIQMLRENGTFLKQWVETGFLWLCHHGDVTKDQEYENINNSRIDMLPAEIRDMIRAAEKNKEDIDAKIIARRR
jgi:hypothetical protein